MASFAHQATWAIAALSTFIGSAGGAVPQLATSDDHTLVLRADGTVWGWGGNHLGYLGDGTLIPRPSPVKIGSGFVSIGAGRTYSFGIKSDGSLWGWGANDRGQLGDGTTQDRHVPTFIGTAFAAVAASWVGAVALKRDGSLWTWGNNAFGTLGNGRLDYHYVTTPQQVGHGFVAVHTSMTHVLALKADGSLWAWGPNGSGQLGIGDFEPRAVPTRIGEGFTAISAGEDFSLAIKQDGTLWSWGWNAYASLGLGIKGTAQDPSAAPGDEFVPLPQRVQGSGFAAVTNGSYHAHALKTDGSLWGWGMGAWGAVGDGMSEREDGTAHLVFTPKWIGDGFWKTTNGGGNNNGFAIRFDGSVWAWGTNAGGQLGDGTMVDRLVPGPIGFNVFPESGLVADVVASGDLHERSLWASFAPSQADGGKQGCIFVAAVLPGGAAYSLDRGGWRRHDRDAPRPYFCGALLGYEDLIQRAADWRGLQGTDHWVGYGVGPSPKASLADMLSRGLVKHVHTVR